MCAVPPTRPIQEQELNRGRIQSIGKTQQTLLSTTKCKADENVTKELIRAARRAICWILFGERDQGHHHKVITEVRCARCHKAPGDFGYDVPCVGEPTNYTELP